MIIPLDSQIQVIQCAHHSPGTFHFRVNRADMVFRDFAYFPKMIQVISEYITPLFKFGFNTSLIDGILNELPYELAS